MGGILVWLITAVAITPLHAQEDAVPVAAYWQEIADLHQLVLSLEEAESGDVSSQLSRAALDLERITAVTLPDGRVIPVRSTYLINRLNAAEPDLAALGNQLDVLLTEQTNWPENSDENFDPTVLAAVLARDEFNYEPEEANFLQRAWQQITRQINEIITSFLELTGIGGALPTLLNIFGAIALAVLLYYVFSGIIADFSAESQLDEEGLDGEILTADLALKRADELSTGGDYRTAVRYLYLSSLLLLEERGLLRYDRSLTNREYLRSVSHQPRLATVLRNVIDVFDRVWYGFQPISKETYDDYARQVDTLKQQKRDTT